MAVLAKGCWERLYCYLEKFLSVLAGDRAQRAFEHLARPWTHDLEHVDLIFQLHELYLDLRSILAGFEMLGDSSLQGCH
jgi:hypothetical protein